MTQTSDYTASVRADFESLLDAFFDRYPDEAFRGAAREVLDKLLANREDFSGKPGGWAGGLVYVISAWMPLRRRHVILNAELEDVFGTTMSTIRKRAEQIWRIIEPELFQGPQWPERFQDFTLRDEANAICAYAFRNGLIEDIHASTDSDGRDRITDSEMKQLMIEASRKVAELLEMKEQAPKQYHLFIRGYNRTWCRQWER